MRPLSVLVLKADRLIADAICRGARDAWPDAKFHVESRVSGAQQVLATDSIDWLITGLGMMDGDVYDLVRSASTLRHACPRIFVVTGRRNPRMLAWLSEMPIHGAFDSAVESLDSFPDALRVVESGRRFISDSFFRLQYDRNAPELRTLRQLTSTEQLAFAVIGDGCSDKVAAMRLNLAVATAHSLRCNLHKKLGLQSRTELMSAALHYGFVRQTSKGLVALGFNLLRDRYDASRARLGRCSPLIARGADCNVPA